MTDKELLNLIKSEIDALIEERVNSVDVEDLVSSANNDIVYSSDTNIAYRQGVIDALKAISKYSAEEPIKNLVEAAAKASSEYRKRREYCGIKDPICLDEIDSAYYEGMLAGADWMKDQGEIQEATVLENYDGLLIAETYVSDTIFKKFDKVIVQIRKKETAQ